MAALSSMTHLADEVKEQLRSAGIRSTDALVGKCASPEDRVRMQAATGIDAATLKDMALVAELFRLKRVGAQYVNLLVATNMGSLALLGSTDATWLLEQMALQNRIKPYVRQLPRPETINDWISTARQMTSKIT
jgi:hypothetical protein